MAAEGLRRAWRSFMRRVKPEEADRTFAVQMLADRLEITVSPSVLVRDLRAKLRHDLGKAGLVLHLHLEDGQPLADAACVSSLPEDATIFCFATSLAASEEKLAELQSPGSNIYDKYLRRYHGLPADDWRVKRTFWAFAVLARYAGETEKSAIPVDHVALRAIEMLDLIWSRAPRPLAIDDLERALVPYYSAEAHERILSWVFEETESPDEHGLLRSERLCEVLADLNYIQTYGAEGLDAESFVYSVPDFHMYCRVRKKYMHLLKCLSCSPDVRDCWA